MIVYIPVEVPEELINQLLGHAVKGSVAPTTSTAAPTSAAPAAPASDDPWDSSWPSQPSQPNTARADAGLTEAPATGGVTPDAIAAALALLQQGGSSAQASAGVQVIQVQGRNGMTTWELNRPDAPACDCHEPAAFVKGSTNGKAWARWTCARGRDRNHGQKCKFNQFA